MKFFKVGLFKLQKKNYTIVDKDTNEGKTQFLWFNGINYGLYL